MVLVNPTYLHVHCVCVQEYRSAHLFVCCVCVQGCVFVCLVFMCTDARVRVCVHCVLLHRCRCACMCALCPCAQMQGCAIVWALRL